ncbi:MAG: DUF6290 family protein [Erysipelotrichaceae bacterium]|nr:DUF6290 family protein [Erysipelotrichaceae bacterium]
MKTNTYSVNISQPVVQCTIEELISMAFSIRLSKEEKELAESYAKLHSMSLGEAFKRALFEKIEDEYDTTVGEEAYREYLESGKKSRPIEELWEELKL